MTTSPKVALGIPTNRDMTPEVVASMMDAYGYGLTDGTTIARIIIGDTYIDTARNLIVASAWDTEATHILWLDSDNVVPRDTAARLLAHNKPVVGGLYHRRKPPHEPVAYDANPDSDRSVIFRDLGIDPHGLHEVFGLGLGCTLVEMRLYRQMHEHFGDSRWHQVNMGTGEDIWFFQRLHHMWNETGHPAPSGVWVDCDLRSGHITRTIIGTEIADAYLQLNADPTTPDEDPLPSRL